MTSFRLTGLLVRVCDIQWKGLAKFIAESVVNYIGLSFKDFIQYK
jgi:hypothetical protein